MAFIANPKAQQPRKVNQPFLETNMQRNKPIATLMAYLMAFFMATALTACGGGTITVEGNITQTPAAQTALTITSQPDNQAVISGQTASFKVEATGSTLSYQWKKNGTNIPGATSSSYTTPPTSNADNGAVFSVSISNGAATATSNATLTVSDIAVAPAITTQPADQIAITGQTATFSVKATGTSLGYQWKKNGSDISGATSSSYTTPPISSGDSGARYSVSVSNSEGTVISNTATLTGSDQAVAPAITTQPVAQTITAGQTATFTVMAKGTGTLTFQWKKNGTDISGATSSSYATPVAVIGDNSAVFSVVVSSSAGTVTSSNATLTVIPVVVPSITSQPASGTVIAGQTATFSAAATGTRPLTYQWKKNGSAIPGATYWSYSTPATGNADDGAQFSVEVSNSAGTTTSSNATLTVFASRYSLLAKASGGSYDKTECVKDNNTGLVWEGKTAGGTRAGSLFYTNYDSTSSTQKSGSNPTQAEIDASTNSIGYRNSVNASSLCGFTDWRVPDNDELLGIVDKSQASTPKIDSTWFPNTQADRYWTSSPARSFSSSGSTVNFSNGVLGDYFRSSNWVVTLRLVRGTPTPSAHVFRYSLVGKARGGAYDKTECVYDSSTGLFWEGKTANGIRAGTGSYTNYDSTSSAQKSGGGIPTQAEIDASTNSIGYVNSVNAGSGLCGFTNWRLPTKEELLGIVDLSQASAEKIDSSWFPNTQADRYWTSSPNVNNSNTSARVVQFNDGGEFYGYREQGYPVRLMRKKEGGGGCTGLFGLCGIPFF